MIGLIKGFLAIATIGFIANIPILMLKGAILKTFLLPVLFTPLFLYLLSSNHEGTMTEEEEVQYDEVSDITNPSEPKQMIENINNNNLFSLVLKSIKMFSKSQDECLEKISCLIGASNNDSIIGSYFPK